MEFFRIVFSVVLVVPIIFTGWLALSAMIAGKVVPMLIFGILTAGLVAL